MSNGTRVLTSLATIGWLAMACDPGQLRDSGTADGGIGDAVVGDGPTGDSATGDAATGDAATGDAASSDRTGVDAARADTGSQDLDDPRQCGTGPELCAYWGKDCGWASGYDRCWEAASAFCGACGTDQICGADNLCVPEICSDTGWCWQRPTPQANQLYGVGGAGSDIWLVGEGGMVLRWDGNVFGRVSCPSNQRLRGVWAPSATDVWIVGERDTVLHYDGERCERVNVGHEGWFVAIDGSGPDDIWIAASLDHVIHYDGLEWSSVATGSDSTYDLWLVAPGEPWILASGQVQRYLDGGWQQVGEEHHYLRAGVGFGPDAVWVVGDITEGSSTIMHWDGEQLVREATAAEAGLNDIWGDSPDNLWAGGSGGCIARRSGGEWLQPWPLHAGAHIDGVGGSGDQVMFGGNYGAIFHWDGAELLQRQQGAGNGIAGFSGSSESDVWAATHAAGVLHWDGSLWRERAVVDPERINAVWGSGDALWGAGDAIYSWGDDDWQEAHAVDRLEAIWGSGPTDIWAGGSADYGQTLLLHYDGVSWEPLDPVVEGLTSVWRIWGSSASDVWFQSDKLMHYDGAVWTGYEIEGYPSAIWASGAGNIWTVSFSEVLRYNGSGFESMMADRTDDWRAIWGRGADDVWVLSIYGVVAHWDGQEWSYEESGVTSQLTSLWGAPSGDLWAGGGASTIVHRRPQP